MILNLKRLFLGMGIIWYFELLAFALNTKGTSQRWTYFADCLNMLQVKPFFIFLMNLFNLFNCKSGCLGLLDIRLQEKCLPGLEHEVRQTLLGRPQPIKVK